MTKLEKNFVRDQRTPITPFSMTQKLGKSSLFGGSLEFNLVRSDCI